jgi:peptide/nickel transport system ATP-binding protein
VVVMYGAQVVEDAPVDHLFRSPRHPYTSGLLEAMPQVALDRGHAPVAIPGVVAQAHAWPRGCRFHPRCGYCQPAVCVAAPVPLLADGQRHVRCARSGELRSVLGQAATARSAPVMT